MINATWLETFTTLCETGHFTRTADMLGMTQPGVSQQLRKLEAQIGKPLIAQDGKTFTLTQAGEAVFDIGLSRRAQERTLRDAVQSDDPDTGTVHIACSGSFALWLYPVLMARMQRAPNLIYHVTAAPQSQITDGVLKGTFDIGIIAGRTDHPRLYKTALSQEELCLLLPATLPQDGLTLDQLNALGFIDHPDARTYADDLLALNFPDTFTGAKDLTLRSSINQIGQIPIPVAQGLGYTILPKSGISGFARRRDIAIYDKGEKRFFDQTLIMKRGRDSIPRLSRTTSVIIDAMKQRD